MSKRDEFGWRRIAEEAQVIRNLTAMGGVELKPPKPSTGFNPPPPTEAPPRGDA